MGSLATYGIKVFEKNKFPQYDSQPQLVAGGAFVASLLATIFINRNTNHHFQRAVEPTMPAKARVACGRGLRPSDVGLGAVQGQPTLALSWNLR